MVQQDTRASTEDVEPAEHKGEGAKESEGTSTGKRVLTTLKRTWASAKRHNLSLVAAGVAFYGMLAIFPAIVALVTVYALVVDPAKIESQLEPVTDAMPKEAGDLLVDQLTSAAGSSGGGLGIGLAVSLVAVLWSAAGGVQALMTGLNIAYGEEEKRGFVKLKALSLGMTFGAMVMTVVMLALVAAFPVVLDSIGLGAAAYAGVNAARWLLVVVLVGLSLAVVYRFGPDHTTPRWRWVSWGSVVALALWIAGSVAFSFYVSRFGSYNETYGTLAAVIVLMLWLFLTAYVVLLGAQLDAELRPKGSADAERGGRHAARDDS